MPILDKLSNLGEGRKLKHLQDVARLVNTFEPEIEDLDDQGLRAKTAELRERHANGEDLDDLLPEAFAVTREGARRTIGQRHFDVQVMGGAALHDGNIAEMKTGEGKTLVSTLPGYLNALTGRGVHIVTVNDYLAKRDSEWMGGIYRFLGLDVGLIQATMTPEQRRPAYAADITYGTNNEFGFDYLRDNMAMRIEHCVQRDHWFAIVDEVDSILIDEARTPADHQRDGLGQREVVPDLRPRRAAPGPRRGLRGRGVEVPGRGHREGGREGRGDPRPRQPLRQRELHARAPPAQRAARQGAVQA